jgi:hypothetical protein
MDSILKRDSYGENERIEKIKDYVKDVALGEQYKGEESQKIKNLAEKIYEERTGLSLE